MGKGGDKMREAGRTNTSSTSTMTLDPQSQAFLDQLRAAGLAGLGGMENDPAALAAKFNNPAMAALAENEAYALDDASMRARQFATRAGVAPGASDRAAMMEGAERAGVRRSFNDRRMNQFNLGMGMGQQFQAQNFAQRQGAFNSAAGLLPFGNHTTSSQGTSTQYERKPSLWGQLLGAGVSLGSAYTGRPR